MVKGTLDTGVANSVVGIVVVVDLGLGFVVASFAVAFGLEVVVVEDFGFGIVVVVVVVETTRVVAFLVVDD